MSGEPVFSPRNPWFTASVGATALVVVLAVAAGFLWFPSLEGKIAPGALWDMICSAAGIGRAAPPSEPAGPVIITSAVIVTPQTLSRPSPVSVGRGATVALQCAICHGARGLSQADTPNLAGQYAASIYKELQDFKSGARTNAVMSPQVVNLTDREMQDVAAYYAFLPRIDGASGNAAPEIVASGAPMRNIPSCGACHGGLDVKAGSPWLKGASANYLRAQLQAFADSTRHNDISQQMRNIARNMTPAEIDAAARYFASVAP